MTAAAYPARIAVIGAGLIGQSWAVVFAAGGTEVRLCDSDPERLEAASAWLDRTLPVLAEAGIIEEASASRRRIAAAPRMSDALDGADWVQECTLEEAETKAQVFAELDRMATPEAVLASSSSSLAPSSFASNCAGRHRCLVAHPVNPPHLVPLVEIVPGPWTNPSAVELATTFMERLGQAPILVRREVPGFILNRLQGALLDEAFRLVEGGYASPEDVDRCMVDGLALRWSFMGPFETIDLNAAGGITEYVEKYRDMYHAMHEQRGPARPWDAATVAQIAETRRQVLPATELADRQDWRDRKLMRIAAEWRHGGTGASQ